MLPKHRQSIVVGLTFLLISLVVFPVHADGPIQYTIPIAYTVPWDCGTFTVSETVVGEIHTKVFADRIWVQWLGKVTFASTTGNTASANVSYIESTDLLSGTTTYTGLPLQVHLPGDGILLIDAGRLAIDMDGNVVFIAGPHPYLLTPFPEIVAQLCAALE